MPKSNPSSPNNKIRSFITGVPMGDDVSKNLEEGGHERKSDTKGYIPQKGYDSRDHKAKADTLKYDVQSYKYGDKFKEHLQIRKKPKWRAGSRRSSDAVDSRGDGSDEEDVEKGKGEAEANAEANVEANANAEGEGVPPAGDDAKKDGENKDVVEEPGGAEAAGPASGNAKDAGPAPAEDTAPGADNSQTRASSPAASLHVHFEDGSRPAAAVPGGDSSTDSIDEPDEDAPWTYPRPNRGPRV